MSQVRFKRCVGHIDWINANGAFYDDDRHASLCAVNQNEPRKSAYDELCGKCEGKQTTRAARKTANKRIGKPAPRSFKKVGRTAKRTQDMYETTLTSTEDLYGTTFASHEAVMPSPLPDSSEMSSWGSGSFQGWAPGWTHPALSGSVQEPLPSLFDEPLLADFWEELYSGFSELAEPSLSQVATAEGSCETLGDTEVKAEASSP